MSYVSSSFIVASNNEKMQGKNNTGAKFALLLYFC